MTIFILPPKKFIDGEAPEVRFGVEGWFTLQALRRGRVVREKSFKVDRQAGPFHNLITDFGLNRLGTENANNIWNRCHVGTGTATPSASDTQLATFLASVQDATPGSATGASGSPDYYLWRKLTWLSAVGALGTVNLTEIGVSWQNTNGGLVSRELIRDGGGSPVAFPITSDEQLRVTYEVRFYPPLTDRNDTGIMVGATSYDTVTRPLQLTNNNVWDFYTGGGGGLFTTYGSGGQTAYSGDLATATSSFAPTGSLGSATSWSTGSYSPGNFYLDISATWSPSDGNGNIRTVGRRTLAFAFQVRYDPVIPKTNTYTLVLNQRISWARK